MLKKVSLNNVNTGRTAHLLVDTDTDEKAMCGAGKASNETAKITTLGGLDAAISQVTSKSGGLEDRAALFSGVARCLERNISTIKSFELQANRVKSPRYRGIIAEVSHQISIGEKISDAMEKFPDAFGPEVIALIRAGEESGRLPEVFKQIGDSQRKTMAIIKKLKKGMIYPGIVTFLGLHPRAGGVEALQRSRCDTAACDPCDDVVLGSPHRTSVCDAYALGLLLLPLQELGKDHQEALGTKIIYPYPVGGRDRPHVVCIDQLPLSSAPPGVWCEN